VGPRKKIKSNELFEKKEGKRVTQLRARDSGDKNWGGVRRKIQEGGY